MKSKKELAKLSKAIDKAIYVYHNAIAENLKESGKEHNVDMDGIPICVTIIGRHDDAIDILIDKVRYNKDLNIVEVHISKEGFNDADYWWDIFNLGYDADYVNDNIEW